jgi:serine protease Do
MLIASATLCALQAAPESIKPGALLSPVTYGFADIVAPLLNAVVNISTTTDIKSTGKRDAYNSEAMPFPGGSPLDEFFKEFFEHVQPNRPRKARALGSGFVIDPTGYIVTNNHVVADADKVTVILNDNTELEAKIIGRDQRTDIALLKISPKNPLPFVTWGASEKARVGDWIIAIGNPVGLGGSVTAGIVSAISRDLSSGADAATRADLVPGYIQTDASINVGNSGGPMFNTNGQVIGVSRAIFSPTGSSVGIGFAIPSSVAKGVVDQLKEFGRTRRGWIGVRVQKVTDDIAESLGLAKSNGALIGNVITGGPAAKAGIQQGDIITSINDVTIDDSKTLPVFVSTLPIGKPASMIVLRKGKQMTLQVPIGEFEEAEKNGVIDIASNDKDTPLNAAHEATFLGLTLRPLDAQLRARFDISPNINTGIVVVRVDPESQAAEKGIKPGDVILEVSQEEVKTPETIKQMIDKAKTSNRKALLFLISQDGELRFATLKLEWKGE